MLLRDTPAKMSLDKSSRPLSAIQEFCKEIIYYILLFCLLDR